MATKSTVHEQYRTMFCKHIVRACFNTSQDCCDMGNRRMDSSI
ncbi:hypothetical protein [Halodesulfovibrio sp.]|nr:hypothetical protein [Halodesulfovibrio sp.]MCT4626613.1 hypothetical protein [Halodesulfovibrio sp.]